MQTKLDEVVNLAYRKDHSHADSTAWHHKTALASTTAPTTVAPKAATPPPTTPPASTNAIIQVTKVEIKEGKGEIVKAKCTSEGEFYGDCGDACMCYAHVGLSDCASKMIACQWFQTNLGSILKV